MSAAPSTGAPLSRPFEASVAFLDAPRRLAFRRESLDPATLAATGVLCETLVTVISPGTELAAYTGLPPLHDGTAYPRLQGYCNVARVIAIGSSVSTVVPGDRVLTFASHRSHFIVDAAALLVVLPPEAKSEAAACAYLYHLGYNAVLRSGVCAGSRVLVVGLGALGLTSVAMAALAGADVYALSDQVPAQALAKTFGARAAHARGETEALRKALGTRLADVVIFTTSAWSDWAIALQLCARRGTLAVLGFPGRAESAGSFNPLESRTFYAKQLRIEAVGHSPEFDDSRGFARFNERANLRYLVEQIVAGRLQPSSLLSGRYPGAQLEQAYADLLARKDSPVTYALLWNRE
ncbi:MAG: zinc-dependent alcohol dehydrogenase [Caldimonas sp.]